MNNKEEKDLFKEVTDDVILSISDNNAKKQLIKKQKKKRLLPYIIATSAVVLVLGAGAVTYNNWSGLFKGTHETTSRGSKTKDSDKTSKGKDKKDIVPDDSKESELESKTVKLLDWQKKSYTEQKEDKNSTITKDATEWSQSTSIVNVTSSLPSEVDGYTSDVSKATNSDGTPNLKYSYQTKENVEYNIGVAINKFINPIFGEWGGLPIGVPGSVNSGFQPTLFEPIFTKDWWSNNVNENDYHKVPILADWAGDAYGGLDLALNPGGTWFGQIDSLSTTSEPESDSSGVKVNVTAKISYIAKLADGKSITKEGTLSLSLIPNKDSSDINFRNLVSDASLSLN